MVRFETQRKGGAEGSTVMLHSKLACHWPTSRTNDLIQCHKLSVSSSAPPFLCVSRFHFGRMVRFETQRKGGAEGSTVMLRSKLACHWPTSRTNDLIQCHKLSVSSSAPPFLCVSRFHFGRMVRFETQRIGAAEGSTVMVRSNLPAIGQPQGQTTSFNAINSPYLPLLLHSSAFQDFTLDEWFVLKRRG